MTDDLVKRLDYAINASYGKPPCGLLNEAKDRIEAQEKRNKELEAALQLGVIMRHAQVAYFKDRSKENLIVSKQAEAAFDRAALGEKKDD